MDLSDNLIWIPQFYKNGQLREMMINQCTGHWTFSHMSGHTKKFRCWLYVIIYVSSCIYIIIPVILPSASMFNPYKIPYQKPPVEIVPHPGVASMVPADFVGRKLTHSHLLYADMFNV